MNFVLYQRYKDFVFFLESAHFKISSRDFYSNLDKNIYKTYKSFFKEFIFFARERRLKRDEAFYSKVKVRYLKYDLINKKPLLEDGGESGVFLHWDFDERIWEFESFSVDNKLISGDIVLGYEILIWLEDEFLEVSSRYLLKKPFLVENLGEEDISFLASIDTFLDKISQKG